MMIRPIAVLMFAALLGCSECEAPCAGDAPSKVSSAGGCTLYRVRDQDNLQIVYFTTCGDTSWDAKEGKVTRKHIVPGAK